MALPAQPWTTDQVSNLLAQGLLELSARSSEKWNLGILQQNPNTGKCSYNFAICGKCLWEMLQFHRKHSQIILSCAKMSYLSKNQWKTMIKSYLFRNLIYALYRVLFSEHIMWRLVKFCCDFSDQVKLITKLFFISWLGLSHSPLTGKGAAGGS